MNFDKRNGAARPLYSPYLRRAWRGCSGGLPVFTLPTMTSQTYGLIGGLAVGWILGQVIEFLLIRFRR